MKKSILFSIVIGSIVGFLSISPMHTIATTTNMNNKIYSVVDNEQKEKEDEYKEKIKKARDNWNTLTKQQKEEVYKLVDGKIKEENRILDKLVEFGVMDKADAEFIKNKKLQRYNHMKENGEYPLSRYKCNKGK